MTRLIKSFRVRVFVLSATIVSATLLVVLALAWRSMTQYQLALLDQRMCLEARRVIGRGGNWPDLGRFTSDVAEKLRLGSPDFLAIRAVSAEGDEWLRSVNWPSTAEPDADEWRPFGPGASSPIDILGSRPAQHEGAPFSRDRGPPPRLDGGSPTLRHGLAPFEGDGPMPPGPRGRCFLAEMQLQGIAWRVVKMQSRGAVASIAVDSRGFEGELLGWIRPSLISLVPLALLLTALGAGLLSRLTIRPVNRMRDAMKMVTHSALDFRLDAKGQDREFAELVAAFNDMLGKLERSFVQASRFSADAAHELKTPLTILRGQIEMAIQVAPNSEVQNHYMGLLDEVGRLAAMSRKLLLLSQADAGHLALQLQPFNLSEALEVLVADAQMMAPDRAVTHRIDPGIWVNADSTLLLQLLGNLISNAVSHGLPGAWIEVSALQKTASVEVWFANACGEVSEDQRQRFFDRFFRAQAARSRSLTGSRAAAPQTEGSGLGLSLAREIALAHGGRLTLESSAANVASFKLVLALQRKKIHL